MFRLPEEALRCVIAWLSEDRDVNALLCVCKYSNRHIGSEMNGLWEERLAQQYRGADPVAYDAVMPMSIAIGYQVYRGSGTIRYWYRRMRSSDIDAKLNNTELPPGMHMPKWMFIADRIKYATTSLGNWTVTGYEGSFTIVSGAAPSSTTGRSAAAG